jgi:hypothetical protein
MMNSKKKIMISRRRMRAKDVQKVRNVVALEEDDFEGQLVLGYYYQWELEDDEREQISDERHPTEKRSYSAVLRGLNET